LLGSVKPETLQELLLRYSSW